MSIFDVVLVIITLSALIMLLVFAYRKTLEKEEKEKLKQLEAAPVSILSQVEEIRNGLLYSGKNSKIVKSKMEQSDKKYIYHFECLCKTNADNWFVLEFNFAPGFQGRKDHPMYNDVNYKRIHPIDKSDAQSMLAKNIELYSAHFDDPAVA